MGMRMAQMPMMVMMTVMMKSKEPCLIMVDGNCSSLKNLLNPKP